MTAAAALKPRHEPEERQDPAAEMAHAMLELFEQQVETLKAQGLETQLRARLARLLPTGQQPVSTLAKNERTVGFVDIDQVLCLTACIDDLERAKHKLPLDHAGRGFRQVGIDALHALIDARRVKGGA